MPTLPDWLRVDMAIGYALLFLVFGGSIRDARANALAMGHAGIMAFSKG